MADVVRKLKTVFATGVTRPLDYRKKQLRNMVELLERGQDELVAALKEDIGKPETESLMLEIDYSKRNAQLVLDSLDSWSSDEYVEKNLVTLLDTTYIHREPYGVVMVIGAWNYPIQLTILPVISAIAAGNCLVIKPSELAPATAKVMENLVSKYMDSNTVRVINGGIPETTELLKQDFDYIFYTGSAKVGRIVSKAASENLTPCTLELGGKCPLYIDETANLRIAMKRIVWAKMINLGQTCVAPDYILCSEKMQEKILPAIRETLEEFYGEDRSQTGDLGRLLNDGHFNRLKNIIETTRGDVVLSGKMERENHFIDLHVITNVLGDDPVMQEELFGPILPIVTAESVESAIEFIRSKPKPLSFYIFTEDKRKIKQLVNNTSSGSVCCNDAIVQLSVETLPFGGVGESGHGAYHGKHTFDTFSHKKSVLIRDFGFIGEKLGEFRYPPYSTKNIAQCRRLLNFGELPKVPKIVKYLTTFAVGAVTGALVHGLF